MGSDSRGTAIQIHLVERRQRRIHTISNSSFQFRSTMARRNMAAASFTTVSDAIVSMGLSRNRENGTRWITQRRGVNGELTSQLQTLYEASYTSQILSINYLNRDQD